jgi:hypothetical protein
MKTNQPPEDPAFEKLLKWLDSDREKAGEKYRTLHLRVVRIFAAKGCRQAEDLADQTFDVIAKKSDWLLENYEGDPALYIFGVARKIHKPPKPIPVPPPVPDNTEIERRSSCLEECLNYLIAAREREVLLRYHQKDKGEKICERKQIAKELGISLNALRIRIWHIHARLRPCVRQCVERLQA